MVLAGTNRPPATPTNRTTTANAHNPTLRRVVFEHEMYPVGCGAAN